jgi:hypothetical protein
VVIGKRVTVITINIVALDGNRFDSSTQSLRKTFNAVFRQPPGAKNAYIVPVGSSVPCNNWQYLVFPNNHDYDSYQTKIRMSFKHEERLIGYVDLSFRRELAGMDISGEMVRRQTQLGSGIGS